MTPSEVQPPGGRYKGRHRVFANAKRQWDTLCQNRPGPMRRCYVELSDNPFPPGYTRRHHQLRGKFKGTWQYEVTGGERVWYRRGEHGKAKSQPVVTYAGPAPPATH